MSLSNLTGICFLVFILLFVFFARPGNKWHYLSINDIQLTHKMVIAFTLTAVVLIAVLPMSLSPYWNGSMILKADKQQYDRMGDALLNGRLYIDNHDIDPALETMENPYDGFERERLGVNYHWDEAYYNHHYYMYFGIVPTILLFIPFKLITGQALLSYQATQIFASLTIIGMFYLFFILCRNFFPRFPLSQYLVLTSAFAILSIGYSIAAPALYCTAIVSGVCLMVWCIICFLKGAWIEKDKGASIFYLSAGSFLGALAFGCRPPLALANIIVLGVVHQLGRHSDNFVNQKLKTIICIVFPYVLVGTLLMLYNYARFDNVFEFGQSYQLTVTDQHNYSSFFDRLNVKKLLLGMFVTFYGKSVVLDSFPFITFNGVFVDFPILLLSARIFSRDITETLKQKSLDSISLLMFFLPVLIVLFDLYWTPFMMERYNLDFYYLLCIVSFIAIAAWLEVISQKRRKLLLGTLTFLSFAVLFVEFLLSCLPFDYNYTFWYPEVLQDIYKGLRFGL